MNECQRRQQSKIANPNPLTRKILEKDQSEGLSEFIKLITGRSQHRIYFGGRIRRGTFDHLSVERLIAISGRC